MTSSKENLLSSIAAIFRDVFDDETIKISPLTTAKDIDGWDSLAHIRLIVSIEKVLKVKFSALEISDLQSVDDLLNLLLKK
jgi:acyl carrier protein